MVKQLCEQYLENLMRDIHFFATIVTMQYLRCVEEHNVSSWCTIRSSKSHNQLRCHTLLDVEVQIECEDHLQSVMFPYSKVSTRCMVQRAKTATNILAGDSIASLPDYCYALLICVSVYEYQQIVTVTVKLQLTSTPNLEKFGEIHKNF